MFEHSVKVPRTFKVAANIFKKVSTEGGSVKTLLYDDKLRHYSTNKLYALLTKTIQHAAEIDKIFEQCSLFKNEPRLDPWLAKIITTELLFGKKSLPGNSKPEQTILSYKEQFEKYASVRQDDKTQAIRRPRYVRINTNLLTTSDAIGAFQDEGYRFIRCTSGSYEDYLKQIQGLTEYDFTQDYHVKTVFVFSAGTKLHEHDLYLENKIILQDKATAMAVHLLAPPPGCVALDMCAAPGMKTTQLAAFMRNEGKIYAVERNEKRYQTLCEFVEKTASTCVETLHKDALELRRGDCDDVEYILLDPSCSGSGMELSIHNYIEDTRLAKLTSLQEKFLKHAMNAFPKAKRIVYSTCSLFPEENERVITNVVKTSRAKWRVQDVKELLKGQWNNIGSGMYGSMGTRCLYAKPDSDLTTGFFLAVLDRDPKYFERAQNKKNADEEIAADDKEKKKKEKTVVEKQTDEVITNNNCAEDLVHKDDEIQVAKKKKKHNDISGDRSSDSVTVASESRGKKRNKKYKTTEVNYTENIMPINHLDPFLVQSYEHDMIHRDKKIKKKDKHKTSAMDSFKESEVPAVQESTTEKSKKKNKHKLDDTQTCEETKETLEVNQQEDGTKKKKKKDIIVIEKQADEVITNDNSAEDLVYEDDGIQNAKKKKKHNNANGDRFSDSVTVASERREKKHNKKYKTTDVNYTEDIMPINHLDLFLVQSYEHDMNIRDKKKKDKHKTSDIDSFKESEVSAPQESTAEKSKKKNKHKSDETQTCEEAHYDETTEPMKKKKKTHKKEVHNFDLEAENEVIELSGSNKKKKKKDRNLTIKDNS